MGFKPIAINKPKLYPKQGLAEWPFFCQANALWFKNHFIGINTHQMNSVNRTASGRIRQNDVGQCDGRAFHVLQKQRHV
jgi:hypothetical protein